MNAPIVGMIGVIFPGSAPPADLERRLFGGFKAAPLTQLTAWRAPDAFAVTAQHAYETDGNAGRFERELPRNDGTFGLVCADLAARDTLGIEAASRLIAGVTAEDHSVLAALDGSWAGFSWDPR